MIKINKLLFAIATVLPTITCLSVSVENVQASSNVIQDGIKSLLDTATKKNIDIAEKSYRKQGLLPHDKTYWAKDNTWKNSIESLHELTIFGTNPEASVFEEKIDIFKSAIRDAVSKNDKTKAGAYLNGMTIYTFLYQFINNQFNIKPQSGNEVDLNDFEQVFNVVISGVEEKFKHSWGYSSLEKLIIGQSDEGKTQLKDVLFHDMKCYLIQFGYVAPIDDENNKKVSSVLSEVLKDKSVSSENKDDKINHVKKNDSSKSVNKNLNQKKKTSPLKEAKKNYIEDLNVGMENEKNNKPIANLNFVTPTTFENSIARIKSDTNPKVSYDRNPKNSIDNIFNPRATINRDIDNKIIRRNKDKIEDNIDNDVNNINIVDEQNINDENQNKINSDVNNIDVFNQKATIFKKKKRHNKSTKENKNKTENNINDNVDNINILDPRPIINKNKKNNKSINKKENEFESNINDNVNDIKLVNKPTINDEIQNNINDNKNNINIVNKQNIINIEHTEPKVENNDKKNDDGIFSLFKDIGQNDGNAEECAESAPLPFVDIENQTGLQSIDLEIETKEINGRDACYLKFKDGANSKFKDDPLIKNLVNGFNSISNNPVLRHGGLSGAENFSQLPALFHALALHSNIVQSIILNYLNKYNKIQKNIKSKISQTKNHAILTKDVVELLAKMWILPEEDEDTNYINENFNKNSVKDLLASCIKTFNGAIDINPNVLFKTIVEVLNNVLKQEKDDEEILEAVEEFVKNSGKNINEHETEDLRNFLKTCNSGVSDNMNFLLEKSSVCTSCSNSSSEQTTSDCININLRDYSAQSTQNEMVSLNFILRDQYGSSKRDIVRHCSNCKEDAPHKDTMKLKFLPQTLVVKFKGDNDQSNVKVSIPEFFDLKNDFDQKNPIIDEQISNEDNTKYFLSAFVFWDDNKNRYITFGRAGPQSSWICYDGAVTDHGKQIVNNIRKFGLRDGIMYKPQMAIYNKIGGQNVSNIYNQIKQSYKNWYNEITKVHQTYIKEKVKSIVKDDSKSKKATNANLVYRLDPLGIRNIGSTCYKNAVMQCILALPPIREYFLENANKLLNDEIEINFKPDNLEYQLLKSFIDLTRSVWCKDGPDLSENKKEVVPTNFYKIVGLSNPLFPAQGQAGDAKDFIIFILEDLHKILKHSAQNIAQNSENNNYLNQYDQQSALNFFMSDFYKEQSVISDAFYFFNETTNNCQNPICPANYDSYNGVQRAVPLSCWNYGIANCLIFPLEEVKNLRNKLIPNMSRIKFVNMWDCFVYNEKVDLFTGENRNYCNLCKQLHDSLYRTKIYTEPNVLILILNRGRDNCFDVDLDTYPLTMNITPFVHNPINVVNYKNRNLLNPDLQYDLTGIVRHIGESGPNAHFIADIKNGNRWYKMNDGIVTERSPEDLAKFDNIDGGRPYILFYVKRSVLNKYK